MNTVAYFIVAAVLIGAALFGSELVRTFVIQPDNVILVQIFIAVLGLVLGVVGLFNQHKKREHRKAATGENISIKGGVHINGKGHQTTMANRVEGGQKHD